jgi:exonuclease SbcC
MIVDRLSVEGFKMIGERIDLTFPSQGRIGIFGGNETGKTTLLQGIEYALYGLKRGAIAEEARENIVSWGKQQTDLLIEFTCGDSQYRLARRISADGRHRAKLVQLVDGEEDPRTEVTSLTEIDRLVQQTTGMDRDTFTKLVFIKQKDLDALRDLAKAKREELLNKVMGIDIFDTASERMRQDISSAQNELKEKRAELEVVARNRDAYAEKAAQRKKLEDRNIQLQREVDSTAPKLADAKEALDAHEWLAGYDATRRLLEAKTGELKRIEAELESRQGRQAQLQLYEDFIARHGKRIEELTAVSDEFSRLEQEMTRASAAFEEASRRLSAAMSELGLPPKTRGEDLAATKNRSLQLSFLSALATAAFLAAAFFWTLILLAPACVAALSTVLLFRDYSQADQTLTRMASASALEGEVEATRRSVSDLKMKLDDLVHRSGLPDGSKAKAALDEVTRLLFRETGHKTLQELKGACAGLEVQLASTTREDLEHSQRALADEIRKLEEKGRSMLTTKPPRIEGLQFTEVAHAEARARYEGLKERVNLAQSEIKSNERLIEQVDADLSKLRADFERYPTLEAEVRRLEKRVSIMSTARQEIWETGRELRKKVIPQAKLAINQVLPTLTDGRYSDFDVTEDLKFRVFSVEAGDYKEREVFSGGTQDQFLIALRLAFTQTILDSRVGSDRYSLFMDECISSSDYGRRQGIFEVLDAMRGTFTQIFVVAHEDISDLVDHHLVLGRNDRGFTEIRSASW